MAVIRAYSKIRLIIFNNTKTRLFINFIIGNKKPSYTLEIQ